MDLVAADIVAVAAAAVVAGVSSWCRSHYCNIDDDVVDTSVAAVVVRGDNVDEFVVVYRGVHTAADVYVAVVVAADADAAAVVYTDGTGVDLVRGDVYFAHGGCAVPWIPECLGRLRH